jgi:hypothetical protein
LTVTGIIKDGPSDGAKIIVAYEGAEYYVSCGSDGQHQVMSSNYVWSPEMDAPGIVQYITLYGKSDIKTTK